MTSRYSDIISGLEQTGNLRSIPAERAEGLVDLTSNDYLGLATREDLREEFLGGTDLKRALFSSSASRLLAGRQREYLELEELLEGLYGRPCLLFNSGYHANTGLVQALAGGGRTLIIADKLVHASIIDGIRLSGAPFERFRHNDLGHLERLLRGKAGSYESVLVIVESVYSMDGDIAPLEGLTALKTQYPYVLLYVDEAHAVGATGSQGLGLCADLAGYGAVDILVGTFGKACCSVGAFCTVSEEVKQFLVNTARSLIFSTALPPVNILWTSFLMRKIPAMESERAHLRRLGSLLREQLGKGTEEAAVSGHIHPYIIGDAKRAVEISKKLEAEGFKVLPIRTPTVPPGTERLRISLSAALTEKEIKAFANALKTIVNQ